MTEKLRWDAPGGKSLHSTPLGNGEVGVNVWTEGDNEIVLLPARTDAWSEHGRLLKLGRVRLVFEGISFRAGPYEESLDLDSATWAITVGAGDFAVRIWVDAHAPVVRIEIESRRPLAITAAVESWRTAPRILSDKEMEFGLAGSPEVLVEAPDRVCPPEPGRLAWCHCNPSSIWRSTMEVQGLDDLADELDDPLLGRTFGGLLEAPGFERAGTQMLKTAGAKGRWLLNVHTYASTTEDRFEDWVRSVPAAEPDRESHVAWWREFWRRSWIRVSGSAEAKTVSQACRLQRYLLACAGRGEFPIKFNGSLHTVEYAPTNPDYRRWGGAYWFQNTRLAYWPMLTAGDGEMMRPLFRMFERQMPLARRRCRKYFGHDGAFFYETQTFWGTCQNEDFGWDGEAAANGILRNQFIRRHYNGNLELLALMIAYVRYTGDEKFMRETLLPMAGEILRFFDRHYDRDDEGRLHLRPGQALETYWDADNNTPDVAGLRQVVEQLLALGENPDWRRLLGEIPPVPVDGQNDCILPAGRCEEMRNCENPELYAVFPFGLYGVGREGLETARNTYAARRHAAHWGWGQDEIHAACLGLAGEASEGLVKRFASRGHDRLTGRDLDEIPRFPGMWGPNYDWFPDMDHGSVGLIALQSMLVQCHGNTVEIFPAWPVGWDVDFRLHALGGRIVKGVARGGKVVSADVSPEGLQVVVHPLQG